MKKRFKAISQLVVVFATGLITLSSCVSNPDSSGLEYTPDMYRSPAIEPYVDYGQVRDEINEEVKTEQSALRPPHETIPYFGTDAEYVSMMLPYHRKASSAANVSHGLYEKEGWTLSDSVNGTYVGVPDYKNLTDLGDGQVFYSIYYGKGAMGAHSMLLNKKEIWTLVHYVNKFRFDDYGNFDVEETPVADSLNMNEEVTDSLELAE